MPITQISYAGFIMLSVEEDDGKLKVILHFYAIVTVWIHSTAKLDSTIIGVTCTEKTNLCSLDYTFITNLMH